MSQPTFIVRSLADRRRVTVLFRYILAYPHAIVSAIWSYLATLLGFFQWWVILFTGKRHESLWRVQNNWLAYATRVAAYEGLLFDKWPNFGPDPAGEPTAYSFAFEASANRLTSFFRLFMMIPALLVALAVGIATFVVTVIVWFAILFTGRHPQGMFDFQLKAHQFSARLNAYSMLMTDDYPKFGQASPSLPSSPLPPPPPWATPISSGPPTNGPAGFAPPR